MVDNIKQDELPVDSLTPLKKDQKEPQVPPKSSLPKYHKVVDSTYFRIALTGVLILLLFLTAFVIAVISELRRQRAEQFDQGVPPAEVIIPSPEPTSIQATDINTSNWNTYRNEEYKYSIKYPDNWYLNSEEPLEIASVPLSDYLHGVGKPPQGNAWITITNVNEKDSDIGESRLEVGPNVYIVSHSTYKQNASYLIKITKGFWQDDPESKTKKDLLDQILSTLQFLE